MTDKYRPLSLEEFPLISDEEWQQTQAEFAAHPLRDLLLVLCGTHSLDLVSDAICELPEQERLVLSLSYLEELTPREIGEILNLTEEQVRRSHQQGMSHLRQKLRRMGRTKDAA